jgi:hypothetical protein
MKEMRLLEKKTLSLFFDSKAAISIAHNPVQHDRTKHIEIDWHFIKEKVVEGSLAISQVTSKKQLADVFIKGLGNRPFNTLVCKLGMRDIFAPT